MGAVVIGLILVQGVITYRTYFHKWAFAPEVAEAYGGPWVDLPQALNAQSSNADMAYLIPRFHLNSDYSFEYLYQDAAPAHVFHPAMPDLAQKIESALAAMENLSTVKVVEAKTANSWIEDDSIPFDFLLRKYGRYVGSDELVGFRGHNYVDISLDRTWTFYEYLEPLTVHYDGGISLSTGLPWARAKSSCQRGSRYPWEGNVHCGAFCNGRPVLSWISIMRYLCACTMQRAKGSTKRMMSYGNRRTIRQPASGQRMRWSNRYSTWTSPAISCRANTSCAWSSTTLRRRYRLSRWVCGSRKQSWRACGWRKAVDGRPQLFEPSWLWTLPVDEAKLDCSVCNFYYLPLCLRRFRLSNRSAAKTEGRDESESESERKESV